MSPPDAAPRGNAYRERVLRLVHRLIEPHLPVRRALDFGAGDGWFARRMFGDGSAAEVVAVDTMLRRNPHFPVELYDGARLRAEFARTESRLIEMGSEAYLVKEHLG